MSSPATPAAAAQSIISQVETDATTFIENTETVLAQDMEAAWTWVKAELAALEPTVLADLKAAVQLAVTTALSGASSGSVVADTLTALAADGASVLSQVKSSVVQAVVGLTTTTPSAS
jgi:hypothetical protein